MTVSVSLPSLASIEDYTGLVAFIVDHLELDSATEAQIPSFIRLAEYRLERRLTVPEREATATVGTTAGVQTVAFPDALRAIRGVRLVADDGYPLEQVSPTVLHGAYSDSGGRPVAFALANELLYLGPVPDAAYALEILYEAKVPALTSAAPTNWLLSRHADVYVYSVLAQAEAFLGNQDAAGNWLSLADGVISEINMQGNRKRYSSLRVRSPGVVV